jgi:hypothetical protein
MTASAHFPFSSVHSSNYVKDYRPQSESYLFFLKNFKEQESSILDRAMPQTLHHRLPDSTTPPAMFTLHAQTQLSCTTIQLFYS